MRVFRGATPVVYSEIVEMLSDQEVQASRGGETREMTSVIVQSRDPRNRMLFRPNINWAFGLQESFAYWMGFNPGHVQRYNPTMERFMYEDDDGVERLHGSAYGRYFRRIPHDQIERVIDQLQDNEHTRQAVVNIHQSGVEDYDKNDVACTVYLHFLLRDGKLNLTVSMRSQDMLWGYPYDTQAFQWVQEVVAGVLDVDLGFYEHRMNSCHYYTDREDQVIESAEKSESHALPDCRLDDPSNAFAELRDGLALARKNVVPRAESQVLDEIEPFYADWLRVMTVYEMANFHDREDVAADVVDYIDVQPFETYAKKQL